MTASMDDAAAARLAAIQRQFVDGLPRRLQEIDAATDAQARHAALHRLAGAAGAFGYPELGDLARRAMGADPAADVALQALRAEIIQMSGAPPR